MGKEVNVMKFDFGKMLNVHCSTSEGRDCDSDGSEGSGCDCDSDH
jgi:hypothetical protein